MKEFVHAVRLAGDPEGVRLGIEAASLTLKSYIDKCRRNRTAPSLDDLSMEARLLYPAQCANLGATIQDLVVNSIYVGYVFAQWEKGQMK